MNFAMSGAVELIDLRAGNNDGIVDGNVRAIGIQVSLREVGCKVRREIFTDTGLVHRERR